MQNEEFDFDREKLSQKLLSEYLKEEDALSDDARDRQQWILIRRILLSVSGMSLIGFFIFAWQTDKFALTSSQVDSLPLVRAEKTPVKIKPDDPGGIKVANMDKSIFSSIDDDEEKDLPKVTRILPAPEAPVKRAEIALRPLKQEKIETQGDSTVEEQVEPLKKVEPVSPEPESKPEETKEIPKIEEKTEPTIEDVIGEALQDIKPEDIKPTPVPKRKALVVPVQKTEDNGIRIQLGAFRTHAEAEEKWKKIRQVFASQLDQKRHYVVKADLGNKGIFYRLQVGGLNGSSNAREICNELIAKKQGCFVVK